MINELIKLATHLDNKGFHKEADYIDAVIKKALPRDIWGRRYRDPWYDDDRGGMDEGYHYRDCPTCGCKTEHESTPTGNLCIPCDDKAIAKSTRKKKDD